MKTPPDLSGTVHVHIGAGLTVSKSELSEDALAAIREAWTWPNPLYDADMRLREAEVRAWEKAKEEGRTMDVRFAFRGAPSETIQGFDEDDESLTVPRGHGTALLRALLTERGYAPALIDKRNTGDPVAFEAAPGWEPYCYQREGAEALIRAQRGYVLAPTAAGKTVLAMHMIVRVGRCTLIIAHTNEILDGWMDEITGNPEADTVAKLNCSDIRITRIQGRKGALDAARDGDIILSTIQSLYLLGPDVWTVLNRRVGLAVCDECHHAPADTFYNALTRVSVKYRVGITATDKRKDRLDFLLRELIGPKVYEIDDATLVKAGRIAQPTVELVATNFYPRVLKRDRHGELTPSITASKEIAEQAFNRVRLLNMMVDDHARNQVIVDMVVADWQAGHRIGITSERRRHCENLIAMLEDRGLVGATYMGGTTSKRARKQKREIKKGVESGKIDVVAGTSVFDEGINFPSLSALHMTCPANNEGKVVQQIGRVRRVKGLPPVVRDYIDWRCPAVIKSYTNRKKWYRKRKWRYTDIDVAALVAAL